jgi:hypothetical protein
MDTSREIDEMKTWDLMTFVLVNMNREVCPSYE